MNDTVRFYWRLLMRRLPLMLTLVALCIAVASAYALSLSNRYETSARLLVEAPQIPTELAATTVNMAASEQLQIIEERLTRRATLIDIANQYKVFGEASGEMSPDEVADAMQRATLVRIRARPGFATFMDINFSAGDANIAAAVVNEYVTRVLDSNVQNRRERAGNTLDFFQKEVDSLSEELSVQSDQISKFKVENSKTLPEALDFRLAREAALDERLLSLRRELSALEEQRRRITSVYEQTGRFEADVESLSPEARQLRELETELNSALAIYSETNPRVKVLRTRVEQLREAVTSQTPGTEDDANQNDPAASVFGLTIAELDARADAINAEMETVSAELTTLREMIERTPQTAIMLAGLERDLANVQSQYDGAVARLARARTGEQIELSAQGQRITVVESPVPPEWPTGPNRKLIAAGGGLAGVGLAAGLFAVLEISNSKIRRPAELVSRVGITPLATIPYIPTTRQRIWYRTLKWLVLVLVFVVLPAALYAIHTYYMPLGELYEYVKDLIRGRAT